MKLENIVIGVLLVILIFLMYDKCNKDVEYKEVIKVDTLHTTSIDTILLPQDTIYNTVVVHEPDTIYIENDRPISVYGEEFSDSLISGEILAKVDGVLVGLTFNYVPKFPKYIIRTDSVLITKEISLYQPKNKLFLGVELGGNPTTFNISPVVGVKTKKDLLISYRYGLLDKTHNVGVLFHPHLKD